MVDLVRGLDAYARYDVPELRPKSGPVEALKRIATEVALHGAAETQHGLPAVPARERRRGEDRRREQVPVLLDTRTGGDRRTESEYGPSGAVGETASGGPERPFRHIDEIV